MNKQKQIIGIVLVATLLILSMVSVSAVTITVTPAGQPGNTPNVDSQYPDNWFGRLLSDFANMGAFTVYGDELGCDKYVREGNILEFLNGDVVTISRPNGEQAFVNWFRGSPYEGIYSDHTTISRQFVAENFVSGSEGMETVWTCDAGAYWLNKCYVEVYECANPICYTNSDCSSGETCVKTIISQSIPNAGVCKTSNPTHTTKVYTCANGVKTLTNTVSYGSSNFCTSSSDSQYIIGSTTRCLPDSQIPQECVGSCGDGVCNILNSVENQANCPQDCGAACVPDNSAQSTTCYGTSFVNNCGTTLNGVKNCTISSGATCMETYSKKNSMGTVLVGESCSTSLECKSGYCHQFGLLGADRCDTSAGANNCYSLDCKVIKDLSIYTDFFSYGTLKYFYSGNEIGASEFGEGCDLNADCESGYCNPNGIWSATCDYMAAPSDCIVKPIVNFTTIGLSDLQKISLTREAIKGSTTSDLIAAACLEDKECIVLNSNYTAQCIPIAILREDGIISPASSTSFFDKVSTIGKTSLYAGTIGIVACTVSLASGAGVVLAPAFCGWAAALVGGTATLAYYDLNENDALLSKLKAKDANSVGLCVAEKEKSYCAATSWAAFFTIPGQDKCTSGLIIIIVGAMFILVIIKR